MKKLIIVVTVLISNILIAQDTVRMTKEQFLACKSYAKSDIDIKKFEVELLNLINSYRKSKGLSILVSDSNLVKASLIQSDYMVSVNKVGHKNSIVGFETPWQRVDYFYKETYGMMCENACTGNLFLVCSHNITPAQQIFEIWKYSPGHNFNMLNPKCSKIGLTISRAPGNEYFYANFVAIEADYNPIIQVDEYGN